MPVIFSVLVLWVMVDPATAPPLFKSGLWQLDGENVASGTDLPDMPPQRWKAKSCITPQTQPLASGLLTGTDCTVAWKQVSAKHWTAAMVCRDRAATGSFSLDLVSSDSVDVKSTTTESNGSTAVSTTVLTHYTFLTPDCGSVQPATLSPQP